MPQALQAKQKILVVAEEDLFWNGMKNKTKEYFRFGAKKMLASKLQGVRGEVSVAKKCGKKYEPRAYLVTFLFMNLFSFSQTHF